MPHVWLVCIVIPRVISPPTQGSLTAMRIVLISISIVLSIWVVKSKISGEKLRQIIERNCSRGGGFCGIWGKAVRQRLFFNTCGKHWKVISKY
ncbi:hypothetical protein BJ742DRAFT_806642 [Cladochytrium replicatum]|nr:hypothetical protein BJ742DRAFT_806642 [Cladochytrium replicatum]